MQEADEGTVGVVGDPNLLNAGIRSSCEAYTGACTAVPPTSLHVQERFGLMVAG